jgi:transcriptional regulator with XRE-family HTH domain
MAENRDLDAERLGRAVQLRRVQLGLKRPELAKRAELSYPYLSEIENGMKNPSTKALRQLAAALELSPAELIVLAEQLGELSGQGPSAKSPDQSQEDLPTGSDAGPLGRRTPTVGDLASSIMRLGSVPAPPASGEALLERRVQDVVGAVVRAELAAWARTELPGLIRAEIERALAEREES